MVNYPVDLAKLRGLVVWWGGEGRWMLDAAFITAVAMVSLHYLDTINSTLYRLWKYSNTIQSLRNLVSIVQVQLLYSPTVHLTAIYLATFIRPLNGLCHQQLPGLQTDFLLALLGAPSNASPSSSLLAAMVRV